MTKKNFWLAILPMVLVFGTIVIGCDNDPKDDGTDHGLNGTWVGSITVYQAGASRYDEEMKIYSSRKSPVELKLNNGNFEMSQDNHPFKKGNYTISGNNFTEIPTHVHGDIEPNLLESKWYTRLDFQFVDHFMDSDEQLNAWLDRWFGSNTYTYSVSGNKLTIPVRGEVTTLTKKK